MVTDAHNSGSRVMFASTMQMLSACMTHAQQDDVLTLAGPNRYHHARALLFKCTHWQSHLS